MCVGDSNLPDVKNTTTSAVVKIRHNTQLKTYIVDFEDGEDFFFQDAANRCGSKVD